MAICWLARYSYSCIVVGRSSPDIKVALQGKTFKAAAELLCSSYHRVDSSFHSNFLSLELSSACVTAAGLDVEYIYSSSTTVFKCLFANYICTYVRIQ